MNILVFNQDWFVPEFRAAGHKVYSCGIFKHLDVPLATPLHHIGSILKMIPEPFEPDLIIVYDNSAPVTIIGIEEQPCRTLFYGVDTHHHTELHWFLSNAFDHTLVAHKDYIPTFTENGFSTPDWFPVWASRWVEPRQEKEHKAVFVGTLKPHLNRDRVEFFSKLEKMAPVLCTTGDWAQIFPKAEIVINQTVKGDLNFRVFEAMMCGVTLLTERSGNGLFDLFEADKHLVTYERNNVDEAASVINDLLAHPERCRAIAQAGRDEILRAHTPAHRAEQLLKFLNPPKRRNTDCRYFSMAINFYLLSRKMDTIDTAMAAQSLLQSMKLFEQGVKFGEKLVESMAFFAVLASLEYDRRLTSKAGRDLLNELQEAYSYIPLLNMARLRSLLNQGNIQEAEAFARRHMPEVDTKEAFETSEKIVSIVLSAGSNQPQDTGS